VHFQMRCWQFTYCTYMLNFVHADNIKIRKKYYPAISWVLYLSKKTISRSPQSHETIPLTSKMFH
jgi:hypothetical protein